MQLKPLSPSASPRAPTAIGFDEAERIWHLAARTAEAKQMLAGVLANLARLHAVIATAEPASLRSDDERRNRLSSVHS